MADNKRKESRIRTKKVNAGDIMANRIMTATVEVFDRFDVDTLDLDTLCHFVLQHFTVSPENYHQLNTAIRDYVVKTFAVSQGDLRRKEDISLRHTLVHYVKP